MAAAPDLRTRVHEPIVSPGPGDWQRAVYWKQQLLDCCLRLGTQRAESGGGGYAESSEGRPAWAAM
eukprot:3779862-Pleurochrysis_carterae.AAC.1